MGDILEFPGNCSVEEFESLFGDFEGLSASTLYPKVNGRPKFDAEAFANWYVLRIQAETLEEGGGF